MSFKTLIYLSSSSPPQSLKTTINWMTGNLHRHTLMLLLMCAFALPKPTRLCIHPLQSGLNLSSVWSSNKKIKINVWSLHSWFKTTIFLFCVELYLCLYRILPQSKDMLVKLIGCGHVCKVWMVVWFYALTWQLLQHPMTAGTDWDPYSERSSRPIVLFL